MYASVIIVFILLALVGSYAVIIMTADHATDQIPYVHAGYELRLFDDRMMPMGNFDRQLAKNGSFSGAWYLGNSGSAPEDYEWLILALVDYRLTPLYYNGSLKTSHLVTYRPPVSCNVSFRLTGLQDGVHDVTFFNVMDGKAMESQGNGTKTAIYENGIRFNVTEGNATKPAPQYSAGPLEKHVMYRNNSWDESLSCPPWITTEPFMDYFSAVIPVASGNATYYIDAAPGEDIEYYINVRNGVGFGNERYGRFAIMQLLDYQQQPIRQDSPEEVYFGALEPGQTMAIHACIKAPETPGRHVLSVVWAAYPYGGADPGNGKYASDSMSQVVINVKG